MSPVEQVQFVENSASSLRRKNIMRTAGLCLLGALLALGSLHTKTLGAAWLGLCIWGFKGPFNLRDTNTNKVTSAAASAWLIACGVALLLASICVFIWAEDGDILNPQFRLLFPAAAALFLIRRNAISTPIRIGMTHAVATASILAFLWSAFWWVRGVDVRGSLASNAIPWAVAVSFNACLLLPMALSEKESAIRRWVWFFGAACAIAAVILSQSRGAFLVIPWCGLVYAWFWHKKTHASHTGFHRTLLGLFCAVTVLLAGAWWGPGDVLRMRQAVQNIQEFKSTENYNTSGGARLYLWDLAWVGIKQSPWIGVGSVERMRRIQHAGDGSSEAELAKLSEVRQLGHVHNQYLNAALDGGAIGLTALLALLAGMAIATRRLAHIDPVAAWQMGGVLFMHATASLTNVNFLHNYYVMALSLAAAIPLLAARNETPSL